ncbi:MAG: hypothetical protein U1F57_00270 [bacterium]
MSEITFHLPNHNTIIINDLNNNDRLETTDEVFVNGERLDCRMDHPPSEHTAAVWDYFQRTLNINHFRSNIPISTALQVFNLRQTALEASNRGQCERSDELVRDSNAFESRNIPMISYHELGALSTCAPSDPNPSASLPFLSLSNALICADRPREGATIRVMEFHRIPSPQLQQIIQEIRRRSGESVRVQPHPSTPRRP